MKNSWILLLLLNVVRQKSTIVLCTMLGTLYEWYTCLKCTWSKAAQHYYVPYRYLGNAFIECTLFHFLLFVVTFNKISFHKQVFTAKNHALTSLEVRATWMPQPESNRLQASRPVYIYIPQWKLRSDRNYCSDQIVLWVHAIIKESWWQRIGV